jgi:hypothetical protein
MRKSKLLLAIVSLALALILGGTTGCQRLLDLSISIEGKGMVEETYIAKSGSGYSEGSIVMLTAKPVLPWKFSHWKGGLTGSKNPVEITITEPTVITAVFTLDPLPANPEIAWRYIDGSFMPSDAFAAKYNPDLYLGSTEVPEEYDVLVIDELDYLDFSVTDFTGKVIVTLDSGVEDFLAEMLGSDDAYGNYWDYCSVPELTWSSPIVGEELGAFGDSRIYQTLDDVDGFTRRADIIQAGSTANADDIILYMIDNDKGTWVWLHIGPHFGNYGDKELSKKRSCEIIDYVLELLAGEEPEFPPLPEPDPEV